MSTGRPHSSSTTSKVKSSSPFSSTPSGTYKLAPHLSSFNQFPSDVTILEVTVSKFPFEALSMEALFLSDGDISTLSLPYDEPARIKVILHSDYRNRHSIPGPTFIKADSQWANELKATTIVQDGSYLLTAKLK